MTSPTRRLHHLLLGALLTSASLAQTQSASDTQTPDTGISIPNMDPAVRPGDNFYLYANGGFIAHTKLPPDRAAIGVFSVLSDRSFKQTASIIEDAAKANAPAGSDQRKIADLYKSYMDESAIESHGLATLKPHLAEIAAIHTPRELAHALGLTLRADVDALNNTNFHTANIFGLWVAPSFNDPDHHAPYLLQGGIELPNRDYYLADTDSMKEVRTKYRTHIAAMFRLAGLSDPEARAIRVPASATVGDAVGQLYVKRFFSPEAKAQAEAIVANLIAAFRIRLEYITWMAPATKKEAITKLGTLQVSIGYPDRWRSYAGYDVKPDNLFANLWGASLFAYHYSISRIGKSVDRKEWCMTPQTVNAVNLPLNNGLNFPAALLQPPFFDPKAPAAHNYGAIGTVIGHELSHTFDSEGAAFDSQGRVRNWWTPEDLEHFNTVTAALAAQYDTYTPFPDLHVNGRQTLGEAIADVAGLAAAYDAFHASLHSSEAPK